MCPFLPETVTVAVSASGEEAMVKMCARNKLEFVGGVLWRYSALRRGLLCPQRQSNQNAAETSLVSDFQFRAMAHGSRQKERIFDSCFSHQDPSHPTSPAGPRRHRLQKRFAASALADGRNCAVVSCTTKNRHSEEKAETDFYSRRSG